MLQAGEAAKVLGQLDEAAQDDQAPGADTASALAGHGLDNDSFYDLMRATVDMFELDLDLVDLEHRLLGDQELTPSETWEEQDNPSMAGGASSMEVEAQSVAVTRAGSLAVTDGGTSAISMAESSSAAAAASLAAEGSRPPVAGKKKGPKRTTAFFANVQGGDGEGGEDAGEGGGGGAGEREKGSPSKHGHSQLGSTLSTISRHFNRSTKFAGDSRDLTRASALSRKRSTEVDIDMTDIIEMDKESCMKEVG